MRYFIELAYNGTPFFGWQVQPAQRTVQGVLENAMSLLLKQSITVVGCGRTDTGVHARQYFAHFDLEQELSKEDCNTLIFRLNTFLPKEITIFRIFLVLPTTHARFDAVSRTYCYYIEMQKNPFGFHFAYRVYGKLDIVAMNQAAGLLLKTEDFQCFSKLHTQVHHFRCKVEKAEWKIINNQLVFEITANRFLRNMVRAIVGTLLLVGNYKINLDDFQEILNGKNRNQAGMSVPAHALFLEEVKYK
jgi:tRNA pseudouridine38-40 synthase